MGQTMKKCEECRGHGAVWTGHGDASHCETCGGRGHLSPDLDGPEMKWIQPDRRDKRCEDAAWYYVDGSTNTTVVRITHNGQTVDVCVDGELRIDLYQVMEGGAKYATLGTDLPRIPDKYKDDYDLAAAFDVGDLMWVDNPWFTVYVDTPTGYHPCDEVHFTLTEAIDQAFNLVGLTR